MKMGDKVRKTKGYAWPGVIVADFTNLAGARRLVVESTSEGTEGALHIYNEGQLEVVSQDAGIYAVAHEVPESARSYITPGKRYEVIEANSALFSINADDGSKTSHLWKDDPHGVKWQVSDYSFWGVHDDS